MGKSLARRQIISILNGMGQEEYARKSSALCERFMASELYMDAQTIGITLSRFPEVETRLIIEAAWNNGKRIVVPRCLPATREMDFREIKSFECLETVYMDLKEPIVHQTKAVGREEIDLQVVPGVVFSDDGYRIGFGGGYYDRYLKSFSGNRVALAFASQTGRKFPVEPHDIPVDTIFTEEGTIRCVRA